MFDGKIEVGSGDCQMKQRPADTVLVTGSSGYLGYAVAQRLASSFTVVGFDRRQPAHPPPAAECLYVDVTSEASLRRGLVAVRERHGDRLASVVHLAAYYDFSGRPSPLYERVTVEGTGRLLRLLREMFAVEQFIFSSTMLVHRPTTPGRPITEDDPVEPTWAYPQSKARTEQVIQAGRGTIPAVVLRLAGVYDDLGHSYPLPRQIQRIFERDLTSYLFPGHLGHGQAFVHLDDVLDLVDRLVARRSELPETTTLLVGEPETLPYGTLQRILARMIHGEEWRTYSIPKGMTKIAAWLQQVLPLGARPVTAPAMIDRADEHYELDITRARTTVGWEPAHRLRDTLPGIAAALLADPWAWYREHELAMPLWLQEVEPRPSPREAAAIDMQRLMELGELEAHELRELQALVLGGHR